MSNQRCVDKASAGGTCSTKYAADVKSKQDAEAGKAIAGTHFVQPAAVPPTV